MDNNYLNCRGDTIRLPRPPRIRTNDLGHNVWLDDIETGHFEILAEPGMESMLEFAVPATVPLRHSAGLR